METLINNAIENAIQQLLIADSYLLEMNVNERSISHRLANYLEPFFPGWDVDCEYNRNHDNPKRLDIHRRTVSSDDTEAVTVFPDIIVHKRGTKQNLLVIEMKKTTSLENDQYDLGKLSAFKEQLGYQYSLFLKLKTGGQAGVEYFHWIY